MKKNIFSAVRIKLLLSTIFLCMAGRGFSNESLLFAIADNSQFEFSITGSYCGKSFMDIEKGNVGIRTGIATTMLEFGNSDEVTYSVGTEAYFLSHVKFGSDAQIESFYDHGGMSGLWFAFDFPSELKLCAQIDGGGLVSKIKFNGNKTGAGEVCFNSPLIHGGLSLSKPFAGIGRTDVFWNSGVDCNFTYDEKEWSWNVGLSVGIIIKKSVGL